MKTQLIGKLRIALISLCLATPGCAGRMPTALPAGNVSDACPIFAEPSVRTATRWDEVDLRFEGVLVEEVDLLAPSSGVGMRIERGQPRDKATGGCVIRKAKRGERFETYRLAAGMLSGAWSTIRESSGESEFQVLKGSYRVALSYRAPGTADALTRICECRSSSFSLSEDSFGTESVEDWGATE